LEPKILTKMVRQLPKDWRQRYNY